MLCLDLFKAYLILISVKNRTEERVMIKGINRQVVEVNDTGCEYFEKIMFFVKPEYACISEGKIRERASMIAGNTTAAPPTKITKNRFFEASKIILSLLCGAAAMLIAVNIFS